MPTQSRRARLPLIQSGMVLLALLLPAAAWAQTATQATSAPRRKALIAATESRLWILRIEQGESALAYRDIGGAVQEGPVFKGEVIGLYPVGEEAYALLADGGFFRCYGAESETAPVLPERVIPLDVTAVEDSERHVLYAVVKSSAARELNAFDSVAGVATSQPFDPDDSALSIVRYGRTGWTAVTACPPVIAEQALAARTVRLLSDGDDLLIFWRVQPNQIGYVRWNRIGERWQTGATIPAPGLQDFWATTANRMPTVVARTLRDGAAAIMTYRLIERGPSSGDRWIPCKLQCSAPEDGANDRTVSSAVGFNQHVALLETGGGRAYISFGRCDGPPALPTLDVFAVTRKDEQTVSLLQVIQMTVLLLIIAFLFAFRRGAIVTPIALPSDRALALTLPRLVACLLDLLPFALIGAFLVRVSVADALGQLAGWAFSSAGQPPARVVVWWALSVGAYALYAFGFELVRQSTLAKRALGIEICADNGKRPVLWQLVIRNAMRFIELMPPFWIMGFVVLLSRNRQRIGDIFARTLAVRRVETEKAQDDKPDDDAE